MNSFVQKFISLRSLEYVKINSAFKIKEVSSGVHNFSEGFTEVELGKNIEEYFPELIGMEAILTEIIAGRQAHFYLEGMSRIKEDRTDFYFDLSILKQDEDNSDGELVIFCEDVTPRMRLEQSLVQASNETSLLLDALTASKAYIDRLVDSLADALFVTNDKGIIKAVNQATKDLLGYTELELIGQHISQIIIGNNLLSKVSKKSLTLSGDSVSRCRNTLFEKIRTARSCIFFLLYY